MIKRSVYILLGSNLGDREKFLRLSIEQLRLLESLTILATSSIYQSVAVEMAPQSPSFLNQVVKGEYRHSAANLLKELQFIELSLGRNHKGGLMPRTIDLDILYFGSLMMKTSELSIPHPKTLQRPFAILPLLEIEPGFVDPVENRPIAQFMTEEQSASVELYNQNVARAF